MALPQMSSIVQSFGSPATLRRATTIVVDHRPTVAYVDTSIQPTVQPANHEDLQVDNIDYSLEYLMVHATVVLEIDDYILWQNKLYKIISLGNYNLYGFYEATAEEMRL